MRRLALLAALVLTLALPVPAQADVTEHKYGSAAEQHVEVTPRAGSGNPWIMVVHGGSWVTGNTGAADRAAGIFSDAGFVVFNVEYRKVTDYGSVAGVTWAEQRQDILDALDWARDHAEDYGADPDRGAIYGFSAGGHLAASAGLYGNGSERVKAIVSASGVLQPHRLAQVADSDPDKGFAGDYPAVANKTLARWAAVAMRCPDLPWASCSARWTGFKPETHISTDDPPIWMTQGTADSAVPSQSARSFQYWMRKAGLEAQLTECKDWGHTEVCALDEGARQAALIKWLKAKTA